MSARLLDGRALADARLDAAAARVAALGRRPCLAIVTAGAPSAAAYLRRIERAAERAGVALRIETLAEGADAAAARARIAALAADAGVDGILPLAPFAPPLTLADLTAALPPEKDVDGLTPANAGRLAQGADGLHPCTPQAAILLAEDAAGSLKGRTATVVGASIAVGRPLAALLLARGATVTIAHADTRDLVAACRPAELLFVAVGKAGLVTADHVGAGAIVIDIGINAVDNGQGETAIVGDVDAGSVSAVAAAISAVPDGVGPLTAACLIDNVVAAATR
ncbi:MAG: bifunctional 5,10-methylenetetrahydrofolate dehydrogenase/5,10-methenyltetrahydrofolate cyclohydrolase [Sphingomonas fennica]